MNWAIRFQKDLPLYRQIEARLRSAIEAGELSAGERLPSVAELARRLKVNKITVLKAYQTLEGEGALTSQVGRGTFVAERIETGPSESVPSRSVRKLREAYTRNLREMLSLDRPAGTLNLSPGVPPVGAVPAGILERFAEVALRKYGSRLYEYGAVGLSDLRERIAARVGGVAPEQVLITNGSQQALNLLACWAREEGRPVACETPTFTGVPGAFSIAGLGVETVPWGETPAPGHLLYICPDFHNPTGRTLPEEGRRSIASWAQRNDGCVVSDEIFRDLRFEGQAPPSLFSLLPEGRRFMVGSLSKTFMTGLRIGYLVADRAVVDDLRSFKRNMDLGGPPLMQAIAAEILADGYEDHLRRMRDYYRVRRDAVVSALGATMPKGVAWTKPEGGFQLWVTLPAPLSSIRLFLMAMERGVAISPGPAHDIDGRFVNCFRIGYGHLDPADLKRAVGKLAEAVRLLVKEGRRERAVGSGVYV